MIKDCVIDKSGTFEYGREENDSLLVTWLPAQVNVSRTSNLFPRFTLRYFTEVDIMGAPQLVLGEYDGIKSARKRRKLQGYLTW